MNWLAIDLDGTIANCDHRLKYIMDLDTGKKLPKNERSYSKFYSNCMSDVPIKDNMEMIMSDLIQNSAMAVFITGRPITMHDESQAWIKKYMFHDMIEEDVPLYMRKEGDYRVDGIVKSELMDMAIDHMGRYPIRAYDDRDSVIEAWRKMNIEVVNMSKRA